MTAIAVPLTATAFLVHNRLSETTAGGILTVVLLAGAIAQPIGGRLLDRVVGRAAVVVAATSTTALMGLSP